MAWTWTRYFDRGVEAAIQPPSSFAFGSVLFAFIAGFDLMRLKHSGTSVDYSFVALYLIVAVLWGCFLTRAIHRLRNSIAAK